MASLNKLLDWVGPLVFIGGVAYLWYAFTNKTWPFNQPVAMMMTPQDMMMMAMDMGVPVEELSRIPVDTTPITTAIPGDMITPLVSTGLSPVLVPTMGTAAPTPTNTLGVTVPMPQPAGMVPSAAGQPVAVGPNQVVMSSGMQQVNIGGTGATSQKSSPIPPHVIPPTAPIPTMVMVPKPPMIIPPTIPPPMIVQPMAARPPVIVQPMIPIITRPPVMITQPKLPTIPVPTPPMITIPKLPTIPGVTLPKITIPTFPTGLF